MVGRAQGRARRRQGGLLHRPRPSEASEPCVRCVPWARGHAPPPAGAPAARPSHSPHLHGRLVKAGEGEAGGVGLELGGRQPALPPVLPQVSRPAGGAGRGGGGIVGQSIGKQAGRMLGRQAGRQAGARCVRRRGGRSCAGSGAPIEPRHARPQRVAEAEPQLRGARRQRPREAQHQLLLLAAPVQRACRAGGGGRRACMLLEAGDERQARACAC